MARTIKMRGVIGWDVYSSDIERQLWAARGEAVEVEISSPGGSVFEGLQIFNLIAGYKGETTTKIVGLAASMASYIALASDKVVALDNSVFVIHNPRKPVMGDYKGMEKTARLLESMASLLAREYENKTGRKSEEIRAAMDEESWYFGQEIADYGFADEILPAKAVKEAGGEVIDVDRENARLQVADATAKMREDIEARQNNQMVAALFAAVPSEAPEQPASEGPQQTEGDMNITELKTKHPDLYASVKAEGAEEVMTNVKAHVQFAKRGMCVAHALESIEAGKKFDAEESAYYQAEANKKNFADNAAKSDDAKGQKIEKKAEGEQSPQASVPTPEEGSKEAPVIDITAVMACSEIQKHKLNQ